MSSADSSNKPTIHIKRVLPAAEGGHHGGAWKIAYADFVTAMMAFFLLMWLLNATSEETRNGLAEYFNPTIVHRPGAAGEDVELGVKHSIKEDINNTDLAGDFEEVARQVQDELTGTGAESMQHENLLRHVVTRMTDEGLVIEVSDLSDAPLFAEKTAQPTQTLKDITEILSAVLRRTRNELAISGYVRSYPAALANSPVWFLSDARAHTLRNLLEDADFPKKRVQRVTGFADRKHRRANPLAIENNRLEVILLR